MSSYEKKSYLSTFLKGLQLRNLEVKISNFKKIQTLFTPQSLEVEMFCSFYPN